MENRSGSEIIESDAPESDSPEEENRSLDLSRSQCTYPVTKKRKVKQQQTRRKKKSQGRVRTFSYSGSVRQRKLANEKPRLPYEESEQSSAVETFPNNMVEQSNEESSMFTAIPYIHLTSCCMFSTHLSTDDGDLVDELLQAIRFEETLTNPIRKTWQQREVGYQVAWETERRNVFETLISSLPFHGRACEKCFNDELTSSRAVRCGTCKKHLCPKCDFEMHSSEPFHARNVVTKNSKQTLDPSEFFDDKWSLFRRCNQAIFFKIIDYLC